MRNAFLVLILGAACAAPSVCLGDATLYPFKVTLDGKEPVLRSADAIFAVLDEPVSANAVITADAEDDTVFINVFPSDERGEMAPGAQPAVIMMQKGARTRLSDTMDGARLEPGYYVMNVVAPSKGTSRVLFQVE